MKVFKIVLFSILGIVILYVVFNVVVLANFAFPIDMSQRPIKILKTGKIETLEYYTASYEVGDTIRVCPDRGGYRDIEEFSNESKPLKAVVVK